jgi:hypothetical protein
VGRLNITVLHPCAYESKSVITPALTLICGALAKSTQAFHVAPLRGTLVSLAQICCYIIDRLSLDPVLDALNAFYYYVLLSKETGVQVDGHMNPIT